MSKVQSGIAEVIISVVGGIAVSSILQAFKQDNLIPTSYFWIFTVLGFAGSIALIVSYMKAGIGFMIGWIIGAFLLKDILSTGDFVIYLISPIAALLVRALLALKK